MDKKTILLVDDEEIILKTLSKDLRHLGFDITTARNGKDAVAKLAGERSFDLVITDLVMDEMDGIQVLKVVKESDATIGVIILTSYGNMTSAMEALRFGADDYLLKPCSLDELLLRMIQFFDRQELAGKKKFYEDILSLCCVCKKIRDDDGQKPGDGVWLPVEKYLSKKSGVKIAATYCPDCYKKLYREAYA